MKKELIKLLLITLALFFIGCDCCQNEDELSDSSKEPIPTTIISYTTPTPTLTPTPTPIITQTPTSSPTPTPKPISNVSKRFYGNWINLDTGEEIKIDKYFNEKFSIKELGQNFIEIKNSENKISSLFLRNGTREGVIRGRLYTDIEYIQKRDKSSGEKKVYSKPILKTNNKYAVIINDSFKQEIKIVSANGEFKFNGTTTSCQARVLVKSSISVGDIEQVLGEREDISEDKNRTLNIGELENILNNNSDNPSVIEEIANAILDSNIKEGTILDENISTNSKDTDLGNIHIPDKNDTYNFKFTKVNMENEKDIDDRYMYEERTYKGNLYFKNLFGETAYGLNYEITTDDPYIENLDYDIVMGSLEANQTAKIPFEITYKRLDKIAHRAKLELLIRDAYGKEWLDYAYLDLYQIPIDINLKTKTSKLKGYFITPEHEVINIDTKDVLVRIPNRPDAFYYFLVASPKSIDTETAYSMGIDVNASDFGDFHNTSAYEPNNTEESATKLNLGESIISFVHKGDLDFYTIDFNRASLSYEPPQLPFN